MYYRTIAFSARATLVGINSCIIAPGMDRVLQAHLPYPTFVVDRHWNVVLSNSALPHLYEGCSAELLTPPVNAMRLILHPDGLGPRILNYPAWQAYSLGLLRRQIEVSADPVLQSLRAEVARYPAPTGVFRRKASRVRIAWPRLCGSPLGSGRCRS